MGPNRSNRQEEHRVIVQRVGNPVDLSLLRDLDQLFTAGNESNHRLEDLQNIKQVLSIALHEHCSSHAEFIYNRSFFAPTLDGKHGGWDLGLGKALWRGFYSCLVFAKGTHQLLINLDGEYYHIETTSHPQVYFTIFYTIAVKHTVFMKKQSFLEFACEIMLHSPSGKRIYGGQRNIEKATGDDVLTFLDRANPNYRNEATFLLKHCKRKYFSFLFES